MFSILSISTSYPWALRKTLTPILMMTFVKWNTFVVFLGFVLNVKLTTHAAKDDARREDTTLVESATNANGPLSDWSYVGCFPSFQTLRSPADPSASTTRSLQAQTFTNINGVAVADCIDFCSSFEHPYGFAGVEQRTICWCDGVIQQPANQTNNDECNSPCNDDGTPPISPCGGVDRVSIFTNGTPSPKIPTLAYQHFPNHVAAFVPLWGYIGCYSDNPASRTLSTLLPNVTELAADTCVTACQTAHEPFALGNNPNTLLFAGLEAGSQCWCGESMSTAAQKLPDIACESMGCLGMNDQACGGTSAMAVYQFNPVQLQGCFSTQATPLNFLTPFQLNIVFLDGEPTVPVTMTTITTHTNSDTNPAGPERDAGILSYCPTCPNPIIFELDTDSQWELRVVNFSNPTINTDTTFIHPGGTVNLVEISDDDAVFLGYCSALSPVHPGVLQLTAFAAHAIPPIPVLFNPQNFISFSLCSNGTAGGRLDIVYRPLTLMPGLYNLTGCKDVILEIDYNVTVPAGVGFL